MGNNKTVLHKVVTFARKLKYVWWFEIRRVILSYKWFVLSMLSFVLVSLYMNDITKFAKLYDLGVYPAALAFFFEDHKFCNIGMLILIFVMSTFPVTDKLQEPILLKCGRMTWATGQLCAVVTSVVVWLVEMQLMVCIVLGESLDFTEWGQAWGSFSYSGSATSTAMSTGIISMRVLMGFEPWEAVSLSMMLVGLTGIIYGLIIFCLDGLTGKNIGEIVLAIWSMGWIIVGNFEFLSENRFISSLSPRNWLNLEQYVGNSDTMLSTIITMLSIIVVLWVIGIALVKKQRIVPE